MTRIALGLALASLTLAAGCGGDPAEPTVAAPSESAPNPSSAAPSAPAVAGSPDTATPTATATGADLAPTLLTGTVGTPEDPDAYVITLVDAAGQPVTSLPAGAYRIAVGDPSTIHNFHLVGGAVKETTTVPEVTDATFDVTLTPGDYTFVCDPHPRMVGSFTVT